MAWFKKVEEYPPLLHIPTHVAIIMDGNGRWAKKRGLPRSMGHSRGIETFKQISESAEQFGIKALTVYAFSTENWKRPKEEVDYLFEAAYDFLEKYQPTIFERQTRVFVSGDIEPLPDKLRNKIKELIEKTKHFDKLYLNIALNYGSYLELTNATKEIANKVVNKQLNIDEISDVTITNHLYTRELPPIDLMIRTGGEKRLSNFMLYQLAYSEIAFIDVLWPDFSKREFYDVLKDFGKRNRRYGGL